MILAIARGGMFVAGALGYALSVKNLHLMNVEFCNGVGSTLDMPVMLPPVPSAVDFSQKKLLIADDVADTGKTIELARDFVAGHEPVIVKRRVSAFSGSDLDVLLRAARADTLVLAGLSTRVGRVPLGGGGAAGAQQAGSAGRDHQAGAYPVTVRT